MVSPSTNTTGITACASMDFPHEKQFSSRDYPKIALIHNSIINLDYLRFVYQTLLFQVDLSVLKYQNLLLK